VRKLVKLALVALGVRAFLRWRKRRRQPEVPSPVPAPAAAGADPAEELRRKLAETRDDEGASSAPPEASVADRRAEVHASGRAALDEMTTSDEA
jgi:hypothetical protein